MVQLVMQKAQEAATNVFWLACMLVISQWQWGTTDWEQVPSS